MRLTADQVRLRLARIGDGEEDTATCLLELLQDVLPDLVASAQQPPTPIERTTRIRSHNGEGSPIRAATVSETHLPKPCGACTPNEPCERARMLGAHS